MTAATPNHALQRTAIRCVLFGPIALLVALFLWGWHTRYLDPGPRIENKTLHDWGKLLWEDSESSEYKSAVATLSRHADIAVPTAIAWTHIQESTSRAIYFDLIVMFQGKGFTIYGEEAHGYRGLGANILGLTALARPDARQALEELAHNPHVYDYERDIARGHLGLQRAVDGWSSATIK